MSAGASILPLSLGLDAIRQLSFAPASRIGFLSVPVEILILLGLSVIFVAAARLLLAHMERLAIREGRLTERQA